MAGDGTLPEETVAAARRSGLAVEIAAGSRFDLALDLARRAPGARVAVSDLDPAVLEAPPPLRAFVDDLTAPDIDRYRNAGLIFGRRLPEELQPAAAALAGRVGATLCFRPLKDELADVGPARLVAGWRILNP